jgi:hypothetical protein
MKSWLKQIGIQLGVTIVALGLLFTLGAPLIANLSEQSEVAQKAVLTLGFAGEAYAVTPDYQVDGTDDDVQVQTALNALPATGGRLVLFAGNWVFSASPIAWEAPEVSMSFPCNGNRSNKERIWQLSECSH